MRRFWTATIPASRRKRPFDVPGDPAGRGPRSRWIALALLGAVVLLVPAAALAVGASSGGHRGDKRVDDRYATQTTSRAATRRAQLRWANEQNADSAYETCQVSTLSTWARLLGVRAEATVVARAFAARNYEPGVRPGVYAGCLAALRHEAG
jgi:hypothetical protein